MGTLPDLYVRQSPHPNAYTLAINGRRPFIVVHTALVELLTPQELKARAARGVGVGSGAEGGGQGAACG
jgi:hypothetical protein